MPRYVALLRGINVGGNKRISMAGLRELFAGLGHAEVQTYLQSGNVLFSSDQSLEELAEGIEGRISAELGLDVRVLVRTGEEMGRVFAAHPFLAGEPDLGKLHVTFLEGVPEPERVARLEKPAGETAEFLLEGREIYLRYPDGYGRTKFHNAFIERRLGMAATTRNWRTVTALHRLAGG